MTSIKTSHINKLPSPLNALVLIKFVPRSADERLIIIAKEAKVNPINVPEISVTNVAIFEVK